MLSKVQCSPAPPPTSASHHLPPTFHFPPPTFHRPPPPPSTSAGRTHLRILWHSFNSLQLENYCMERKEHFLDRESPDTFPNPTSEECFCPVNYAALRGVEIGKCPQWLWASQQFTFILWTSVNSVPPWLKGPAWLAGYNYPQWFHLRFESELRKKPPFGVSSKSPKYLRSVPSLVCCREPSPSPGLSLPAAARCWPGQCGLSQHGQWIWYQLWESQGSLGWWGLPIPRGVLSGHGRHKQRR